MLFCSNISFGQYPHYYNYNDETGAPSNVIYSIAQDNQGLIWIGTDAGLFKFDGIKYTPYKSATQKSKAFSELSFSSSGKLYCLNFQSQIFYVEQDSLTQLGNNDMSSF